jgi:Phage terminase large subunit
MPEPTPSRDWQPHYICCWCGSEFTQRMVDGTKAWVCPSEPCYLRQVKWKIVDIHKKLFYLPMPRLVDLEEAVASQQYGAICLGGDRSGGKSVGIRALIYRYCLRIENFAAILLRREFPELELNHMRFMPLEAKRLGARYADKQMKFKTGAMLRCGHCHSPKDYAHYVGGDVDLIVFGQLEQFSQEQFTEISPSTGRIRRDDWRGLVLAEENPGGPLADFVKTFFIDKNPDRKLYPNYAPEDHHFIASQLDDNPYTDPRYVRKLANLAYERREMFRYGRRDIFPGQFFKTFDKSVHVTS